MPRFILVLLPIPAKKVVLLFLFLVIFITTKKILASYFRKQVGIQVLLQTIAKRRKRLPLN